MLGCEVRILPKEQDSLPGAMHLEWDQILKINEDFRNGIKPDIRSGLGQKTIDAAHHVEEVLKDYPKLQKYLHIYQPDTQGLCSLVEAFSELRGLTALNMSQPDMNNMDGIIYPNTIDKDIQIIGMAKFEIRRCDREGINLKGMVHVGLCVAAWMGEPEKDPRGGE